MTNALRTLVGLALVAVPAAHAAGNYVGTLRPVAAATALAIPEPGFYWRTAETPAMRLGATSLTDGFAVKLGFRYSKYLSLETGYGDTGASSSPFGLPGSHRGRGFTMDTLGTLPLWGHGSLYGRLGAWRADAGTSLLGSGETFTRPGAGIRYGLGFKYDLTRRVGLSAELERFSPLDRWGTRESDTDQVTPGVRWRV